MATQALAEMFGIAREAAAAPAANTRHGSRWMREERARRGPTPEIFFTRRMDNSRLVKLQCPARKREMRSFAGAMTMLFMVVLFYGWQHYQSIQAGYHIEAQKQQLRQLEEANRELRLSEAQLSDPARIDRMAREMGMKEPAPGQVIRPDGIALNGDAPVLASLHPGR